MSKPIVIHFEKFALSDKYQFWSSKNVLKPEEITKVSEPYLFDCNECFHEIKLSLSDINRGRWCSYCSNKKLCDCDKCFEKSFASSDKSKYWSSKNIDDKNELINPRYIFKHSHTEYWFDCHCGHQFKNSLRSGCPYCANLEFCDCNKCYEKSFASHEKAKYWSSKNNLKPTQVTKGSDNKYLFDCECGHTFDCSLGNITRNNNWCPYCANQKLCDSENCDKCYEKSFASCDKAKYWSDKNINDKNELINPRYIFKNSHTEYWFDCHCGHTFDCSLGSIANNSWCSYCANKKLCHCDKCYEKSFALSDKAKYWSHKNVLKPREVFKSSNSKYWFDCNECCHTFDSTLASITNGGTWCPYCANRVLCESENCDKCYEKSFASSDKATQWSIKNILKPREVFKSSGNEYLFDCDCGHEFKNNLDNITKYVWCPYCANRVLCESENCDKCYEKSFASTEKAKYWSSKNELNPRDVFKHSNTTRLFDCECGHTFDGYLSNIIKGAWCGYCSNPPKQLCDDNNCKQCYDKSFAYSNKAKYWSSKNENKPRDVFISSGKKYWFNCDKGHEFEQILNTITRGCWCRYCVNKTEQILYDKLITQYPSLQQQFKVEWCKKKQHLPFDFVIPELNIIIELDGRQHFEQVSNWSSPEETQENDKYKMECANQNNYSVIRLLQEDVFYNTYNWSDELNQNIQKIIKEGVIQNIYMCKNNEYDADVL